MHEATFLETRQQFSPTSLTLIIALHAAAITAAMAWKLDPIDRWTATDTKIFKVPEQKQKVERPKKHEPARRQRTIIDPVRPLIVIPPFGQPVVTVIDKPIIRPITDPTPLPPDPPPISQAAKAKGDVRTLFTSDDYPESARRTEETGTVQAKLQIGANGKVTDCSIVTSSGSAALDATTCRVLKARARFTPAKDSGGQPVSDSYVTPRIVWRIEGMG